MKFNFIFAFCNLIGLGSGVLSDCVDQDNFSWGPFAYSLAVSPVAAAAGSLTSELGLALDSSGKIMLFASFCNGIKSDVSIEFDVVLGFWTGIDKILGDTVSIGVGSDILELESGTEEEGGNVELVFSKKDGFVGGTLSIGYGYGPEIEFPVELNLDRCSTYELRRFDLRNIAAKVFHWIALFLDKKISQLKV